MFSYGFEGGSDMAEENKTEKPAAKKINEGDKIQIVKGEQKRENR